MQFVNSLFFFFFFISYNFFFLLLFAILNEPSRDVKWRQKYTSQRWEKFLYFHSKYSLKWSSLFPILPSWAVFTVIKQIWDKNLLLYRKKYKKKKLKICFFFLLSYYYFFFISYFNISFAACTESLSSKIQ